MSDDELKALVASLAVESRKTDEQMKMTYEQMKQTDEQFKKTDLQLRKMSEELGGLSNKFGSFTEGLAYTSCKRILKERFGMEEVAHEVEVERKDGRNAEFDMVGVANGEQNEVVVVEIKSHLRPRDLENTLKQLRSFTEFLPQHKGKKIHGLIAAVYLPKGMVESVAQAGLYLATGADENFQLLPPPKGFKLTTF